MHLFSFLSQKTFLFTFFFVMLGGLLVGPGLYYAQTTSDEWYDDDFQHRVKVTIGNTKVDANLTNFPVYVDLSNLPSSFFDDVQEDGADIRITEADGVTEVPREVVAIDTGGQMGELHFKASSLSSDSDTEFYLYYDNPNADAPAKDSSFGAQNVWTNGYEAVYHFQEDPTPPPNLLVNPRAQDGVNGWTQTGGSLFEATPDESGLIALSENMFYQAEPDNDSVMHQDIDLSANGFSDSEIDNGNTEFLFSAYQGAAFSGDPGQIVLQFRDGSGNVLGTHSSPLQEIDPQDQWERVAVTAVAPSGTRVIRARIRSVLQQGSFANTGFDELHLNVSSITRERVLDSTAKRLHGMMQGDVSSANLVSGKLGGNALTFDGVDDYVHLPRSFDPRSETEWALSTWFQLPELPSVTDDVALLTYRIDDATSDRLLYADNDDFVKAFEGDTSEKISSGQTITTNEWISAISRHASGGHSVITDGVNKGSSTSYDFTTPPTIRFGMFTKMNGPNQAGVADEARIMTTAPSDGWVSTRYNNHNSPATFYNVGAPEMNNTPPVTPTNQNPIDGEIDTSVTPMLEASDFSDSDAGDTHESSQWQISTSSNFIDIVYDSGVSTSSLTSLEVPSGALSEDEMYFWHVRYTDQTDATSMYSTSTSFTTGTVETPSNASPEDGAEVTTLTPILTSSEYQNPAGNAHQASQWVLDDATDFQTPIYDAGATSTALSSLQVPEDTLENYSTYYFKVRHQSSSNVWSDYSPVTSFTENVVSPAQVIINDVIDTTIEDITADVRITNEGDAQFEYTYEYCVVETSSNVCGGNDDVDYAQAAKLIEPGENFDTELTLTVPESGDYFYRLFVEYGDNQSSEAINFFTATDPDVPDPVTAFSALPTAGMVPLEVSFTNESENAPTSFEWDFGDGMSSTEENPTHMYNATGTYTVVLTTTNDGGSDTATSTDLIQVNAQAAPTVTTGEVTDIAQTTATGNGNVTSDGGADVTERGVVWATSTDPTLEDSKMRTMGGVGNFSVDITDLMRDTDYFVRAYAENAQGVSYGSEVTFTTLSEDQNDDDDGSSSGGGSGGGSNNDEEDEGEESEDDDSADNDSSDESEDAPDWGLTRAELGGYVDELRTAVQKVQKKLFSFENDSGLTNTPNFTRNLTVGSTGTDVKDLQTYLNTNRFVLTVNGPGSPGNETIYFGPLTQDALIRYQVANNITPAIGYFGPITRDSINQ